MPVPNIGIGINSAQVPQQPQNSVLITTLFVPVTMELSNQAVDLEDTTYNSSSLIVNPRLAERIRLHVHLHAILICPGKGRPPCKSAQIVEATSRTSPGSWSTIKYNKSLSSFDFRCNAVLMSSPRFHRNWFHLWQ